MWDVTRAACIAYNGELYNYRELRQQLVSDGFRFQSESDTEVLLNLYLRDGPDMLERLEGIYAFAIWDSRSDELFIARDALGVKPIYTYESKRGFLFASELKALLQAPDVDRSLDPDAVLHHLTLLWSPAPHTMLKNVSKLEPGTALIVRAGRVARRWAHYKLPLVDSPNPLSIDDATTAVRESLREAVRRQLVADVPIGAFLSGGLDSSSLVALYRELEPDRDIQCFTIAQSGAAHEGFSEDLPYAREVAKQLDVKLDVLEPGPEMIDRLPNMLYSLDEPQADPAPINAMLIAERAREAGIKVLLSGAGGDDIFTGYRRHVALHLEKYWGWLPHPVRRRMAACAHGLPARPPALRRLGKLFEHADLDGDDRLASYFYWLNPSRARELVSADVRQEIGIGQPATPLLKTLGENPLASSIDRMLSLEVRHFLADHNLNYTDKTSMASGVEVRVPFLDRDLVKLAMSLPTEYKQRGRTGKWILKRAMEPLLPHHVIYRPKTGFGAPLRGWLHGQLKPMKQDLLCESALSARGLFDPAAVQRLVADDDAGRVDGSYPIFGLMCIELWCQLFVDSAQPTPPLNTGASSEYLLGVFSAGWDPSAVYAHRFRRSPRFSVRTRTKRYLLGSRNGDGLQKCGS